LFSVAAFAVVVAVDVMDYDEERKKGKKKDRKLIGAFWIWISMMTTKINSAYLCIFFWCAVSD